MKTASNTLAGAFALVLSSGAAWAQEDATVAFLMPDQASTRYEQHDFPGFKAEMGKLCPGCTVVYQNANADVALQQQQFNSVIAQGAKVIVLDPVDSAAAAGLVQLAERVPAEQLDLLAQLAVPLVRPARVAADDEERGLEAVAPYQRPGRLGEVDVGVVERQHHPLSGQWAA